MRIILKSKEVSAIVRKHLEDTGQMPKDAPDRYWVMVLNNNKPIEDQDLLEYQVPVKT